MEKQITLTAETFKALAGEKRVQILKELVQRRKTQSELAHSLGLSAPTIAEHLSLLEKAGLVHAIDEGRKWKYFALTEKGKEILNPGETKILVLLGASFIGFLGTVSLVLYRYGLFGGAYAIAGDASARNLAANPTMQASSEAITQANQQTLQEGVKAAIQNAFQQGADALKSTAGGGTVPAMEQGIQDVNRQLSQNTIEQIANQASQEILPKLMVNPPAPAPIAITKIVPMISMPELTVLVFFAIVFGVALGYYLHYRKKAIKA